jgi:S1-C subfamily serine protease
VNPVDPAQQAADFLQRIERDQQEARRQAEALQQHVAEAERRAMDAGGAGGGAGGPAAPAIAPRNTRLGVRILEGPEPDAVTVTEVLPGERAAKLGLKPMDTIRSLNGRKVTDGDSLRQSITESKGPVVVEIVRDGQTLKLTEK